MNTATRVYNRGFSARKRGYFSLSSLHLGMMTLVLGLLLSAFGVVYTKDLNRRLFIQYQGLQQMQQQYQVGWSKLLLEQSTWSTQSRIQRLAQRQLSMVTPASHNIVLVEDESETLAEND